MWASFHFYYYFLLYGYALVILFYLIKRILKKNKILHIIKVVINFSLKNKLFLNIKA